jgi:hypothetical protein
MTNEIIGGALEPTVTNTVHTLISITTCHPPIPVRFVIWAAFAALMPLVSGVSYVRHWKLTRGGAASFWPPRIIMLAALSVSTLTVVEIVARLQFILFTMGTMIWGEAQRAMTSLSLSHCCMVLSLGTVSTAFCVGLRVMLPRAKQTEDRQSTGPRDGVPAAHDP